MLSFWLHVRVDLRAVSGRGYSIETLTSPLARLYSY